MTCSLLNPSRCVALGLAAICATAPPAKTFANPGPIAQVICDQNQVMRMRLSSQFSAERAWQGLRNPEEIMELWQDASGDWTLVIAYANGSTCIVAMGGPLVPFVMAPHG